MRSNVICLAVIVAAGAPFQPVSAAGLPSSASSFQTAASDSWQRQAPSNLQDLVTAVVLENMPHQYVDQKHWGMTSTRWDGLKVRREGLRIKTKRRKKEVNHGKWRMYRISLVSPEKRFQVRIENFHRAGSGRVGFDMVVIARLHAFARTSNWKKGVQLYSLSTDADADVQMRISCLVGMQWDMTHLPPDVVLKPEVTDAQLHVSDFRVHRISKVDGPLAEELGRSLHGVLQRKIKEKQEKLVEKINRQIVKNEDKLRLSLRDMTVRKWTEWFEQGGDEEA